MRVRLSNLYGRAAVRIGAARVALVSSGADIDPASDRVLRFSARASVATPPNATVISDPVALQVPPDGNLAIILVFRI